MSSAPGQTNGRYADAPARSLYALPAEPAAAHVPSLIDAIVEATAVSGPAHKEQPSVPPAEPELQPQIQPQQALALLELFLQEPSPAKALALWLSGSAAPGAPLGKHQVARILGRDIARLDTLLSAQVNAILHHPRFQQIEASWRGLRYLVEQLTGDENLKIRVLSISKRELFKDADRAIEFDQSQIFKKVYEMEFGMPGGEPYGLLIGDYEFTNHPEDVDLLTKMSGVAAAAFAPFITGVQPSVFGMDQFTSLEQPLNLPRTFEQPDYVKWKAFRDTEDARFVGLALPRVLMRLPYEDDGTRADGFRFRETTAWPDRSEYLWGNAAYAFGAVVVRSFARSHWLADIRGVARGVEGGGLVAGLPVHSFSTDKRGVAPKCSTDVIITDLQEPELSDLGFIPLCHCKDTGLSAFYANQSAQKPKKYDDLAATLNAKISSMLQYTLCVSRFAHYLKSITRDKVGAFSDPERCEDYLHRWLQRYVVSDGEASAEIKAERPLREARVRVREHPGKPGSYLCTAHLWPHFELDELAATLKVTTELIPGRAV